MFGMCTTLFCVLSYFDDSYSVTRSVVNWRQKNCSIFLIVILIQDFLLQYGFFQSFLHTGFWYRLGIGRLDSKPIKFFHISNSIQFIHLFLKIFILIFFSVQTVDRFIDNNSNEQVKFFFFGLKKKLWSLAIKIHYTMYTC